MHLKVRELLLRLESTIEICLVEVDSIIKDNTNCNKFKVYNYFYLKSKLFDLGYEFIKYLV